MKRFDSCALLVIVTMPSLSACASTADSSSGLTAGSQLDSVVVVSVDRPPFVSGVIKTWVDVRVSSSGKQIDVLVPYFAASQQLPGVGQVCSMLLRPGTAHGISGKGSVNGSQVIVGKFECKVRTKHRH